MIYHTLAQVISIIFFFTNTVAFLGVAQVAVKRLKKAGKHQLTNNLKYKKSRVPFPKKLAALWMAY